MIYLIYGSDTLKARTKARQLADSLIAKKPDVSFSRYSVDNFQAVQLEELISGQGLFVARRIIVLDTLFTNAQYKELVVHNLEALALSQNIFIILEGKILKPELKMFEKYAEKIEEHERLDKSSPKNMPSFALADALGSRDKKTLWALYAKELAHGAVPEELHGLLFWQIKTMILAATSTSSTEANLKPFVYTKAKNFSRNFSATELQTLSRQMLTIYHDAHRGLGDLGLLLEKMILEL